jgi:hypothetical protein
MIERYETFRRVQPIHKPCGSFAYRPARRNETTRIRVSQTSRRESKPTRPEARHQKKTEGSYFAFRRPLGNRNLESFFRFFVLLRGQFRISQPLAYNLRTQETATIRVIHRIVPSCTIVKSECLFIDVAKQVKWLYADISSAESALKQAPEILDFLRIYLSVNILLKMVYKLMIVFRIQVIALPPI